MVLKVSFKEQVTLNGIEVNLCILLDRNVGVCGEWLIGISSSVKGGLWAVEYINGQKRAEVNVWVTLAVVVWVVFAKNLKQTLWQT